MTSIGDMPQDSPFNRSLPERIRFFRKVCRMVVDRVWAPVSLKQLKEVASSETEPEFPKGEHAWNYLDTKYTYCVCKQGMYLLHFDYY